MQLQFKQIALGTNVPLGTTFDDEILTLRHCNSLASNIGAVVGQYIKAGTTWLNIEKKLFKIYEKSFALVIKNVEDDNVPADGATYKMTKQLASTKKEKDNIRCRTIMAHRNTGIRHSIYARLGDKLNPLFYDIFGFNLFVGSLMFG